jgi:hypothetical protein
MRLRFEHRAMVYRDRFWLLHNYVLAFFLGLACLTTGFPIAQAQPVTVRIPGETPGLKISSSGQTVM